MARDAIEGFFGEHRWLSNFWPARVTLDGVEYQTLEHAYVAAKTLDSKLREQVRACATPGEAKRLGRTFALRADWDAVKLDVMLMLLREKFRDPALRAKLLATGDARLTEVNHWGDVYWGVCRGAGANHLGRLLMRVRDELRGKERSPADAAAALQEEAAALAWLAERGFVRVDDPARPFASARPDYVRLRDALRGSGAP